MPTPNKKLYSDFAGALVLKKYLGVPRNPFVPAMKLICILIVWAILLRAIP